jgi:hypothetical protein
VNTDVHFGWRVGALALVESALVGWRLERIVGIDRAGVVHPMTMPGMDMSAMPGMHHDLPFSPLHWLRYVALTFPLAAVALFAVSLLVRRVLQRQPADSTPARLLFAVGVAVASLSVLAGDALSGLLFDEPLLGVTAGRHYLEVALIALRYAFALGLVYAAFFGVPWDQRRSGPSATSVTTESTLSPKEAR